MSRPQKSNSVVKISLWPINQWYDINHTLRVRMWEHFWVFKPLKWSEMKQGRPLINSNTDTLDTYGLTMYMHGKKKKKKKHDHIIAPIAHSVEHQVMTLKSSPSPLICSGLRPHWTKNTGVFSFVCVFLWAQVTTTPARKESSNINYAGLNSSRYKCDVRAAEIVSVSQINNFK